MSEAQFLEEVRSNQGIIYKLVALYARDAEEKKDLYQENIVANLGRLALFQGGSKIQHLAVPHLLKYHFHPKKKTRGSGL